MGIDVSTSLLRYKWGVGKGVATVTIQREPRAVFQAVTDISRMGEWSPECTGCSWLDGATGPAVGAKFQGKNRARIGPVTVKKWTTTSEVTKFVQDQEFEFVTDDFTHWRYEFIEIDGSTRLTESFRHEPYEGFSRFLYETLTNRRKTMIAGMQTTLETVKAILEGRAE